MLSNLRDKLLNVSLFSVPEDKPDNNKETINVHSGGSILQHFQDHWKEIHELNEENAKGAGLLASDIEKLSESINSSKKNIALITHILSSSNICSNITGCLQTVKDLYCTAETVEQKLIDLENLIDEIQFEQLKQQHIYHLEQYDKKKKEAFESCKSALEENHAKKVTEYEASKKLIMEERQKVFQDAFKTDLELYKTLGTIPDYKRTNSNSALLEEIQLDYDQNELSHFFDDTNENT